MADFNADYHVFKDYGLIFDENRNKFGTLRSVQWVKQGNEPDETKAKLELRKIITNDDGEMVGKGYVFDTPEGPHELTEGLVNAGFGNTKKILKSVAKRKDFKTSVDNINKDDDNIEGFEETDESSIFDMRNLMNIMDGSSNEEE